MRRTLRSASYFVIKQLADSVDGVFKARFYPFNEYECLKCLGCAEGDDDERLDLISDGVALLDKTHGQMIIFPNVDDVDFQKVSKILTAMVAEAVNDDK
jgi:hypothetical protein